MHTKRSYRVDPFIARVQLRAADSDAPFRAVGTLTKVPLPQRPRRFGYIDPGSCEVRMRDIGAMVREAWYAAQLCELRIACGHEVVRTKGYITEITGRLHGASVAMFALADAATICPPPRRVSRYRRRRWPGYRR